MLFYSHIQKLYTSDNILFIPLDFYLGFLLLGKINRIILNSKRINIVSKDEWKMIFRRRVRSTWRSACVSLTFGVTLPETTCESWRDHTSTQVEPDRECVSPGAKPNVERPINPMLALDSPVASELSICTQWVSLSTACPSSGPTCEF
jgi:hypothetical protein